MGPLRRTVAIAVVAILLAGSCSGTVSPAPSESASPTAVVGSPLPPGETPRPGGTPSPTPSGSPSPPPTEPPAEPPPTSEELIDEALASGEIDDEAALVYKVSAAFGDDRLPRQYRGDDSRVLDTIIMAEVAARFDSLSAQAQETLWPFTVPPYYEGSWWNLRFPAVAMAMAGTATAQRPPCAIAVPPRCPVLSEWAFLDSFNGKVRVWYQVRYADTDGAKAGQVTAAIDKKIWSKLRELMEREPLPDGGRWFNGGGGRLDIALVDMADRGLAVPYAGSCEETPVYILLNRGKAGLDLLATTAHELMHGIQFSYKVAESCGEYDWLMEATATWAMDHVYDDEGYEDEQGYAPEFLGVPQLPLEETAGDHEYGAYLFYIYLARREKPELIRSIWANTQVHDSLEAIEIAIPGRFKERWPEFARYNWNEKPVDRYWQWDKLIHRVHAPELPADLTARQDWAITIEDLELEHLSAQYSHFKFDDPNVRTVTFYNGLTYKLSESNVIGFGGAAGDTGFLVTPVAEEQRKGGAVWALVKIGGQWKDPVEWTDMPMVSFCRDVKAERVEEMVLIFSNSEYKEDSPTYTLKPQGDPPTVWLSNMGCWKWTGDFRWRTYDSVSGKTVTVTATGLIWERVAPISPVFPFNPDVRYELKAGHVEYKLSAEVSGCTQWASLSFSAGPSVRASFFTANNFIGGDLRRAYSGQVASGKVFAVRQDCGGGPEVIETKQGAGLDLRRDPNDLRAGFFHVKPDGITVDEKGREGEPDHFTEWEWHFTAQRQP